ncbi:MAG: EF-P lysine aminoacylase EpmA [Patescibacteria group bacterium]
MNISLLKLQSSVIKSIRTFFDERGYVEMHTPRLVGLPGQEPYLEPFWTNVITPNGTVQNNNSTIQQFNNSLSQYPAALITSPEYSMKRLLASGMDKIYDLGPCFRNEEPWDGTHDPEFLMLEWYRKNGNLKSLMDEVEELIEDVGRSTVGRREELPSYRPTVLPSPISRITCEQAWREYIGVDLGSFIGDREAMAKLIVERGQTVSESDTWDDLYFKIFLSEIEPELAKKGCFLYRYPISMAALARPCADDPRFAERVELYLGEVELANGFHELADANIQRERFIEEQELRRSLGKKVWPLDEKFLSDLPYMGDAVGIAFGVDRLVMLLAGAQSINDVIPFSARERFASGE